MGPVQVLVLIGGISKNSLNKKLFQAVRNVSGQPFNYKVFDISHLPFFSQDIENEPPSIVTEFKRHIEHADAILFVTPEYNRSLPGVLKNAIDWGSRPYGQSVWENKIAGIIGASVGNIGTFGAQQHLRLILSYLNVRVMEQPEFYLNGSKAFDEKGHLLSSDVLFLIEKFLKSFSKWIDQFQKQNMAEIQNSQQQSKKAERIAWATVNKETGGARGKKKSTSSAAKH